MKKDTAEAILGILSEKVSSGIDLSSVNAILSKQLKSLERIDKLLVKSFNTNSAGVKNELKLPSILISIDKKLSDQKESFETGLNNIEAALEQLKSTGPDKKTSSNNEETTGGRASQLAPTNTKVQPVSIKTIQKTALTSLENSLLNVLPKAIKLGIKDIISPLEQMFADLADTVEDSSYQPGLLDYLMPGGGRGGRPGRTRRGKGEGRRGGLGRPVTRPGRLGGLGRGLGALSLLAAPVLGVMEYGSRKDEDQTNVQAGAGTAGSLLGGGLGGWGGAAAGAALGTMILPGVGTIIGGALGGLGGGLLGSMAGGSLADKITGVGENNKQVKPLTTEEADQHSKLIKYVQGLGKYSTVREFLDAVKAGKETRIRWNPTEKTWEPRIKKTTTEPAKSPSADSTENQLKTDVENAEKSKGPTTDTNNNLPKKNIDPENNSDLFDYNKQNHPEFLKSVDPKLLEETEQFKEELAADTAKVAEAFKAVDALTKPNNKTEIPKNNKTPTNDSKEHWDKVVQEEIGDPNTVPSLQDFTKGKNINTELIPKLKDGGVVPATEGGRDVTVAEAGKAEAIVPLDKYIVQNNDSLKEAKLTNGKLDGLGQGIEKMAAALMSFSNNLPQGTTIINSDGKTQEVGSKPGGTARFLKDMTSAARMYTQYAAQTRPATH